MQPSRWPSHRAFGTREHGLVIAAVLLIDRTAASDIGRQRHVAALFERLIENGIGESEGERDLAGLALFFHCGVELFEETHAALGAKAHDVAAREPLCRLRQCAPTRAVEPLD